MSPAHLKVLDFWVPPFLLPFYLFYNLNLNNLTINSQRLCFTESPLLELTVNIKIN